eukprot:4907489-Ditylum_brightwellii.AAC.1
MDNVTHVTAKLIFSAFKNGASSTNPQSRFKMIFGGIPFGVASFVFKTCAYELLVAAGAA